jgi:toxin HigB-1
VIKSFRHRGLEKFFRTGSKAGIQPKHAGKLRQQLFALDNARLPEDMSAPGWKLHPLAGETQRSLGGQRQRQLAFDVYV